MTVQELKEKLNEITNTNLAVVILSDKAELKSVEDVVEEEIRYVDMLGNLIEEPKICCRIK